MNEQLNELLDELGIYKEYTRATDGSYVIDLEDSNEFGKMYTKLDNSDLVEQNPEMSLLTAENSSISYLSEFFDIQLISDFLGDNYKLVFKEILNESFRFNKINRT